MKPDMIHLAIEGIDGCGKGSQVELLANHLQSRFEFVRKTAEPTNETAIGNLIRDQFYEPTLTDDELNVLFAADRIAHKLSMQNCAHARRAMLPPGESVIYVSDRSVWSAYAYHGIDNPMHKYLSPEMSVPDFTVVLDISVEQALARLNARVGLTGGSVPPDRFENSQRLTEARDAYHELARRHPDRLALVDASGGIYQVAHEVCTRVDQWLAR